VAGVLSMTVAEDADALSISGMSNYTVKNVKEIDNAAERFGIEGMEARFGRKPLELEKFGFSYQVLTPNFRQPFGHRHASQEEAYLVLRGSGRIKVEDDIVDLKEWDAIRIPAGRTRQLEAGAGGMDFLAIGAPEGGDAEMIEGWWSD
jgi:mannose-6-phosphate isomerase-like protein (cupin superfamily)